MIYGQTCHITAFTSRQSALILIGLLCLVGCKQGANSKNARVVHVVSWGGTFQQDLSNDWWAPAAKSCGITLESDSWDGDYGALTSRIQKRINDWDLVHVEANYVATPTASALFQEIPNESMLVDVPALRNSRAVPLLEYGYVLASRTDLVPSKTALDWKDFFDTNRYSARRAIRDFPVGNIEIALLSQGRNLDTDLYNKDLSRAQIEAQVEFALDQFTKLKDKTLWWSTGDQLQRLLSSGDVGMAASWSGRVSSAAKQLCGSNDVSGCKLQADARTSLVSTDWWIIPQDAPHAESARQLLRCLYENKDAPSQTGAFSSHQGYLVPLKNIQLPDASSDYYLRLGASNNPLIRNRINEAFWGRNYDWISARWQRWRLAH